MDTESQKITYHRLIRSTESPVKDCGTTSSTMSWNTNQKRTLPDQPLVEELQTTAQTSNSTPFPLFTRFLPNEVSTNGHSQQRLGLMSAPLLLTPDGAEQGFERNCSSSFQIDEFFKYKRLKPSHRFLCAISPTDAKYTLLQGSWPAFRQVCLLAFFTCLVGIMCFLIGLLITSPLPPCEERHKWFQGAMFYEIFPASFQDTDGDGFGDFRGIAERLDYIKDLGAKAIRLNSVFSALDYPLEYEHIIDLKNVDPHLGRLRDFKDLVRDAHKKGIRVVLDINPTVTSDQHTWALHWQRGIDGYQHFYASANRSKAPPEMEDKYGPPPDLWELTQRTFGGHYFVNWSSPFVHREYLRTINFWIELGVDGFYMKHLDNIHVLDKSDIRKVVLKWREELDRFRLWSSNADKVLMTSIKFAEFAERTLDDPGEILANFDIIDIPIAFESNYSAEVNAQLNRVKNLPWRRRTDSPWVMWHVGSSENFRFANRVNSVYREAALYTVLLLPESSSVFYGDEIGLVDSYDVITGNVYRGGQFAPMQWTSDNITGGFTDNSSEPWLPLTQTEFNVRSKQDLLDRFVRFSNIRNVHSWNREYRLNAETPDLFALERPDSEEYQLLFYSSFSRNSISKNFSRPIREVNVLASTSNFTEILWNAKHFSVNPGGAFVAEIHLRHSLMSDAESLT